MQALLAIPPLPRVCCWGKDDFYTTFFYWLSSDFNWDPLWSFAGLRLPLVQKTKIFSLRYCCMRQQHWRSVVFIPSYPIAHGFPGTLFPILVRNLIPRVGYVDLLRPSGLCDLTRVQLSLDNADYCLYSFMHRYVWKFCEKSLAIYFLLVNLYTDA